MEFSFFVLNVSSLSKHYVDLKDDMFAIRSDHVCIVETWIDPDKENIARYNIPDRSFKHASYGKGKGCAIYSRTSKSTSNEEMIIMEKYQVLSFIDGQCQLLLVYLSSRCHEKDFDEIADALPRMFVSGKKVLITGDFNFDKSSKNALTRQLEKHDFVQLITTPTHDDGRTIDHCYVQKDFEAEVEIELYSPYYSDHDALCINLKI